MKIYVGAIALLMLPASYATTFKLLKCMTENQTCSTCETTPIEVTPVVNSSNSTVQLNLKSLSTGKQIAQSPNNCKVVNAENWNCVKPLSIESSDIRRENGGVITSIETTPYGYSMIDGQLIFTTNRISATVLKNGKRTVEQWDDVTKPMFSCYIKK